MLSRICQHLGALITTHLPRTGNLLTPTFKASLTVERQAGSKWSKQGRASQSITNIASLVLGIVLGLFLYAMYLGARGDFKVLEAPCGNTTEEAHQLGCRFDYMSFSWLHPRCFDEELVASFSTAEDWHWYADGYGQNEIPRSEIIEGNVEEAYVTWEYHRIHCAFMWQLLHRRVLEPPGKMGIDSYVGSFAHTQHCGKVLTTEIPAHRVNTAIRRKFPDCGLA